MPHMTDEDIIAKMDKMRSLEDARSREYHRRMARYAYRDLPPGNER